MKINKTSSANNKKKKKTSKIKFLYNNFCKKYNVLVLKQFIV